MCGYFGNFSFEKRKLISGTKLRKIANTIAHRGPDGEGFYEDSYVSLAFKRLSIIDIKNGNQPFTSQNKKFVLVFNGEIYNSPEIKSKLNQVGISLKTNSDTEALLEGLSFWGMDFLKQVNGMFSFALYNERDKKIFLVRDRLGIKPLFFAKVKGGYLFASEMQCLLKSKCISKNVNLDAISSYLSFRSPIGVGTYFNSVEEVNPGEMVVISDELKKYTYWNMPINNQSKKDFGENFYLESTKNLLKKVVKDHMLSDVPVGSLLSGGLDSSLLTVLMEKDRIKTFSASFDKKGYDESEYANLISNQIKSNHINITLDSKNYIEKLDKNIQNKGTPLSIPHEIALNELFKSIKSHNKVVISGEGADELFGGYGRVQSSAFDYKKMTFIKKFLPKYFQKNLLKIAGSNKTFNWSNYKNQCDHFIDIYSWFSPISKKNILSADFFNNIHQDKKINIFWEKEFNEIINLDGYDKILYLFEKHHLRCLLDRLDFHSMSSSVEARVPFCDHRLVEHVMNIPFKYKFKWKSILHKMIGLFNNSFKNSEHLDTSKYLLRECSKGLIPEEIIKRKKKGFPVPLDDWFSEGLNKFAKDILLDGETNRRGIFNITEIENLINNKEKVDYDFWGKKIWMLVNIELWYRNTVK